MKCPRPLKASKPVPLGAPAPNRTPVNVRAEAALGQEGCPAAPQLTGAQGAKNTNWGVHSLPLESSTERGVGNWRSCYSLGVLSAVPDVLCRNLWKI